MKNIDATLIAVIDDKLKQYVTHIDEYLSQDRIEIIVMNSIKGQVERYLVQKFHEIIHNNQDNFVKDCIDDLFHDEKFINTMRDRMKSRIEEENYY